MLQTQRILTFFEEKNIYNFEGFIIL